MTERALTTKEASGYLRKIGLRISTGTLKNMRCVTNSRFGAGPPYTRFDWGGIAYSEADLDAWAQKTMTKVGA